MSREMTKPNKCLIRVFAVRIKKAWVFSYPLSAQRRLVRLGGCTLILLVLSCRSSCVKRVR